MPSISVILSWSATPKTKIYNNVVTIPGIIVCFQTVKKRKISLDERV